VDIAVATADLAAAEAAVEQARSDLDRARVLAPRDGTIIDVAARTGERPPADGLLQMGDTARMEAELEVFQTMVPRVAVGQDVSLVSGVLGAEPLTGTVARIGTLVGRQSVTADDPAANTDARVLLVTVALDEASSARAARYVNLEVVARISVAEGAGGRPHTMTAFLTRLLRTVADRVPAAHASSRPSAGRVGRCGLRQRAGLCPAGSGRIDGRVRRHPLPAVPAGSPDSVASESETLSDAATLPRQRLFQALVHPDVTGGTPIYMGRSTWISGHDASSSIQFFGLAPDATAFFHDALAAPLISLSLSDTVLVDTLTRFVDMRSFAAAHPEAPVPFEIQNRQLGAIGTVSIGGGFGGDGVFLVSDQTFFHLFPQRSSATPSHILLALAPGADPGRVAAELAQLYPPDTVRIRPVSEAMEQEVRYQMTERPTGLIFAFGVAIGIAVGIVIAYQVLSADVADHIREYATFKAMGFRQGFFVGIILEEAIILAAIGFWPGWRFRCCSISHWPT
jgi:DevC protein